MLFLLFPNTLIEAQSVKDPQPLLEEHGLLQVQTSVFYQPRLLLLLLMFFKHAQVHRSGGCPAGLVNLRGIPPHATHQHVIGDLVRFAALL